MNDNTKILIVEDDRVIRNFLSAILSCNGFTVAQSITGGEAQSMVVSQIVDLILLDLGLPDIDGLEVLRNIRSWSDIPVIVLSARQDESEKVRALDAGADDYVTKPFGNNELLARIRTALRRHTKLKGGFGETSHIFSAFGLHVDYAHRLVTVDNRPIHLTPIEYRILELLTHNSGKVLTHDYIMREIWGQYGNDRQVLWVNMANIRRKIEPIPADPMYIFTVTGVGYRMVNPEPAE